MKKYITILIIFALISFNAFSQAKTVKYRITAVKKNDYSITSQSNIAEVETPLTLYIPNAFSPNGDGLNDAFGAVGDGIQEYQIQIYDRWGELIFETNNLKEKWDGTYKGKEVQEGVYVYNISVTKANQNKRSFTSGTVTLVK